MNPAIPSTVERAETERGGFLRLIPGIILLTAIGYAGKLTEQSIAAYGKAHHVALPNIEYVLWAILFGLAISNTVGIPAAFRPGVDTYEFWLKVGIVFQGVRFLLGDVLKLGGASLLFVAIELGVSIALMTWLGRKFGLTPKLTSLLAIGSSICGVSAIIAAKGAIEADDEDASYAIAAILALGAFSLFAFPAIGHALGMATTLLACGPGWRLTTPRRPRPPAPFTRMPRANSPCSPRRHGTRRLGLSFWLRRCIGQKRARPNRFRTRRPSSGRSFRSSFWVLSRSRCSPRLACSRRTR
jgi:hypothetical protein